MNDYPDTEENNINALFRMALERLAIIPFAMLVDVYRYDLFRGDVPEAKWNEHWEHLREKYQKVRSPVKRTEHHFDPGAKFHIPGDYQYITYFVAHSLEFQLYRSLCLATGRYDPKNETKLLHKCDIYQSVEAGNILRAGLSLGRSKHWTEALRLMTNETKISAKAMLEYFRPLHEYLERVNAKTRESIEIFSSRIFVSNEIYLFRRPDRQNTIRHHRRRARNRRHRFGLLWHISYK